MKPFERHMSSMEKKASLFFFFRSFFFGVFESEGYGDTYIIPSGCVPMYLTMAVGGGRQ